MDSPCYYATHILEQYIFDVSVETSEMKLRMNLFVCIWEKFTRIHGKEFAEFGLEFDFFAKKVNFFLVEDCTHRIFLGF